jgi:hypothetical protein
VYLFGKILASVVEKPHSIGESISWKHTIWGAMPRTCYNKATKSGRSTDGEGVRNDDCRNLVVHGPDRACVGCFAGCALPLTSAVALTDLTRNRSMDSMVLLMRMEAQSSALGAVRPAEVG